VADVAEGAAADKWYYADFEGLRHLPAGPAIREAIAREGDGAAPILRQLAQTGRLERALRVLSSADCARLVDVLPGGPPAPARAAWARALAAWPAARRENGRYATPANQLRLWLAAYERGSETAAPDLPAITHLLNLADLLAAVADPAALARHLARGELGAAVALARSGGREGLESLPAWRDAAAGDEAWSVEAATTLAPPAAVRSAPFVGSTFSSPAGGLFLLLPILLDLRLFDVLAGPGDAAQGPEEHDPAPVTSLWLYWLALKCLGGGRAGQWRDDPALLLAVGLDSAPAAPAAVAPEQLAGWRQAWRSILRHQGRADGRFLALETASTETASTPPVAILRDVRYDYWLDAGPPDDVRRTADHLRATAGDGRLLLGDERPDWLAAAAPDYAARAKPVAPALAYFSLPDLPPALDATLTVLAQGVMRTLARHLLGFAWSSPAYLYDNFLAGDSLIALRGDEIHVQLPASPLHTVLRLTGRSQQRYTLPWLPDRVIQVTG
jgi:hypothetical protein